MSSQPPPQPRASPFQYTDAELDTAVLASWTTEMVAQAMLNAGIELSVADRFMENDISGAILITLKFEDLKELSIQSFGIRTKVWHQIQALRDSQPASPRPETPIEDVPSRDVVREIRRVEDNGMRRRQSSRRKNRTRTNGDDITPMESVSIIGIEQVIPKPHHCSKGENCSKYRKQQQLIRAFKKEYPHVDINATGTVMIGDAGNPQTAKALDPNKVRPVSDAEPSVVASSDVMGPGMPPIQYLYEASLRGVQARDPQDNVRQFLNFQHQHGGECSEDVPPHPRLLESKLHRPIFLTKVYAAFLSSPSLARLRCHPHDLVLLLSRPLPRRTSLRTSHMYNVNSSNNCNSITTSNSNLPLHLIRWKGPALGPLIWR
ncbi:hypothetical protein SNK04_008486 [Fusarium graminearum]